MALFEAGHRRFVRPALTHVTACGVAKVTLSIERSDSFVTSTAAPMTTGWNNKLPDEIHCSRGKLTHSRACLTLARSARGIK